MTEALDHVEQSLAHARQLMTHLSETHEYPIDSLMACVLVIATLAHGVGMPLDTLVEGVTHAYNDVGNSKKDILQ